MSVSATCILKRTASSEDFKEDGQVLKCMKMSSNRLQEAFYDVPCSVLARRLLGQVLVRQLENGQRLSGRIVETESYLGAEDKASHSYQGDGAAVLLRALEPLDGVEHMEHQRAAKQANIKRTIKLEKLCNGPSKLCQALEIDKVRFNEHNLCTSPNLWLEAGEDVPTEDIIQASRIGIDSAGEEWSKKPLRFYISNCRWVSIRNRQAEDNAASIQC